MKRYLSGILGMLIASVCLATTVTFDEPSTNTDGSPLTDLASHRVYRGQSPGNYTEHYDVPASGPNGGQTVTNQIPDPTSYGTYYYAATSLDSSGNESSPSNEVRHDFFDRVAPAAPSGLGANN